MSDWDDLEDVTQPRISEEEADRLVTGTASGSDEARDVADLSAVFQALRQPAEPAELAGLHAAVAAFGDAVVTTMQTVPSTARTRPMFKKLLTGKAIAAIGVVTLASAGAAAAAGVVPSPFETSKPSAAARSTHDSDDDIAVDDTDVDTTAVDTTAVATSVVDDTPTTDAPDLADEAKAADSTDTNNSTDGSESQGPDVNGPAKFGLCTAWEARTKHDATADTTPPESTSSLPTMVVSNDSNSDQPPPFKALSDAAGAAGQTVADFCADAVPGGESSDTPGQSGGNPSATAPGRSKDDPTVTTQGQTGGNPSATAPGHSGGNPSGTAPGQSGGAPGQSGGDHGKPVNTHP